MEEGINVLNTVKKFDNGLTGEIDLDYVKAKLEHNKELELAEIEEAVEYLKTDLKLKLNSNFIDNYGIYTSFFNSLTSKHIELLALTFVKWFIEKPEEVNHELETAILETEYNEDFTSETTVLNILDSAINSTFIELSTDKYKPISSEEIEALRSCY